MKQMIGIICDLDYSRHILFKNYYFAIQNLYSTVKLVETIEDLNGIDMLFIGDDHYRIHKAILWQEGFIDKCNSDNIKVVVFTTERIFNSAFSWNEDNYRKLMTIKSLYHYTSDVDDCIKLGVKLNRMLISKHFKKVESEKLDQIVFIGSKENDSYKERRDCIKIVDPIIIESIDTWENYINTIARYRFVFCPSGNNNAFTMRFYECLLVGSIPVQQVKENTLNLYNIEAGFKNCLYFQNPEEVSDKIKNCIFTNSDINFWLEDYLQVILTEDGLL